MTEDDTPKANSVLACLRRYNIDWKLQFVRFPRLKMTAELSAGDIDLDMEIEVEDHEDFSSDSDQDDGEIGEFDDENEVGDRDGDGAARAADTQPRAYQHEPEPRLRGVRHWSIPTRLTQSRLDPNFKVRSRVQNISMKLVS